MKPNSGLVGRLGDTDDLYDEGPINMLRCHFCVRIIVNVKESAIPLERETGLLLLNL